MFILRFARSSAEASDRELAAWRLKAVFGLEGVIRDKVLEVILGILVVLSGILGAKVLMILVDLGYYTSHPREIFSLATLQAGGVFSGGFLAAIAAFSRDECSSRRIRGGRRPGHQPALAARPRYTLSTAAAHRRRSPDGCRSAAAAR